MISFLEPESNFAKFNTQDVAAAIRKAHMQFTEARLMDALIARFGELPSREEIEAHCCCVYDPDNVAHYIWFDVKPQIGEEVDMSNPLVSIAPPKYFTSELEN